MKYFKSYQINANFPVNLFLKLKDTEHVVNVLKF